MSSTYAPFPVRLAKRDQIAENFMRLTFHDESLTDFGTTCLDQRIKLVFTRTPEQREELLSQEEWFSWWRLLDESDRPTMRTYTVRHVRPELGEVDVDFALHGATGPAATFALQADIGDDLVLVGPVEGAPDASVSGIAWHPGDATTFLLAGDETAAPAIGNILRAMRPDATGAAFIEVVSPGDVQDFEHPDGVSVTWLPRIEPEQQDADVAARGNRLCESVFAWTDDYLSTPANGQTADDYDELPELSATERDVLWDETGEPTGTMFTWVAADAPTVARLRRGLRKERGLPRSGTSFMGYWRPGFEEN